MRKQCHMYCVDVRETGAVGRWKMAWLQRCHNPDKDEKLVLDSLDPSWNSSWFGPSSTARQPVLRAMVTEFPGDDLQMINVDPLWSHTKLPSHPPHIHTHKSVVRYLLFDGLNNHSPQRGGSQKHGNAARNGGYPTSHK